MTKKIILQMSLGPVQGFVSQARRTRDLWAGSFLLSYLAGQAIQGVVETHPNSEVILPNLANDPLFLWISNDPQKPKTPPQIGSIPNRFRIAIEGDEATAIQAAKQGVERLKQKWNEIAQEVWKKYIEPFANQGIGVQEIWGRQIENFWEVQWAIEEDQASSRLDQLKNWRIHYPKPESGDKCTLMGQWQEISGYSRAKESKQQNEFWKSLQVSELNVRSDERLCAIALVKRLFPLLAKENESLLGWKLDQSNWPSTAWIASIPWVQRVANTTATQDSRCHFVDLCKQALQNHSPLDFSTLKAFGLEKAGDFGRLEGRLFDRNALDENQDLEWKEGEDKKLSKDLSSALEQIAQTKDASNKELGYASPFYAMLLMDGDSLGAQLRALKESGLEVKELSSILGDFTSAVPSIVQENQGTLVYAGGDDVLAMLPLDTAVRCAQDISNAYRTCFQKHFETLFQSKSLSKEAKDKLVAKGTISAGLVLAHYKIPMRQVIDLSHSLLDDVAKEGNGRDSIAIAVLKPSGLHAQWVTTWNFLQTAVLGTIHPEMKIHPFQRSLPRVLREGENLLERVGALFSSTSERGLVSASYLYNIRDLMGRLFGWSSWEPGNFGTIPQEFTIEDLFAILYAEYAKSYTRVHNANESEVFRESILMMMRICFRNNHRVDSTGQNSIPYTDMTRFCTDSVFIARFLQNGGREDR